MRVAMDNGLDVKRLADDMDKGEGRAALVQRRDSLTAGDDFTGVPTVFFGNEFPMIGAVPIQVYQQAVERLSRPTIRQNAVDEETV
jgi:predicted DsbA family dithiol-disulfide isomerase